MDFVFLGLCICCLLGVCENTCDVKKSVSVMEGGSVTLYNNFTDAQNPHLIMWSFGHQEFYIAKINREANRVSINDSVYDGMFRHRLQVDAQTGSLTITNITTQHSGVYNITISGTTETSNRFIVTVYARLPVPVISSQCSSSSSVSKCVVLCSVLNVSHVSLSWYKGSSLLSSISVSHLYTSVSLHLDIEYQDTNTHMCVLSHPFSNQTQHLDLDQHCQPCSGLTFTHKVVISCVVVGSVMIVAALLIFCICRKHTNTQAVQSDGEEVTYTQPTFCKRASR